MWKVSFLASFLAAFITMDGQFFGGATTRLAWRELNAATAATQAQVRSLIRAPQSLAQFSPAAPKR
jgi:hypothetical protein